MTRRRAAKARPAKARPAKARPAKARPAKARPAKARPAKSRPATPPAVSVADLQRRKVDLAKVEALAAHVLVAEGRPDAALSVTLVDDEAMAELHARYSKVEGPTDVLAFPLDDGPGSSPGSSDGPGLLGEVVVSTDTAAREARARGLPFVRELLLYVAHGTLHLLGHDDHDPVRRRKMHRRQSALLAGFDAARRRRYDPRA